MKRFSQFILRVLFLFASTTAFASSAYASFRNTGPQTLAAGNHLAFPQTDVNVGGGITKQPIGGGDPGDQFIVTISGDYLINSSVDTVNIPVGNYITQYAFDLQVNGVTRDRITTNFSSSIILSLSAGDVIQFRSQWPLTLTLYPISGVSPQFTETNTSAVTFHKMDGGSGGPAASSTCPGGLH